MKIAIKSSLMAMAGLLFFPLMALEIPAVTYIGRITDPEGLEPSLADPHAQVKIRRVDNQALLAEGMIYPIANTRYNYIVNVPMTTLSENDAYGKTEVQVQLEVKIGSSSFTSTALALPEAGTLVKYDLAFATDANQNGVADEYEEMIAPDMAVEGIDGPYDADADYDGDGMSNRDEYYAGTDPFNEHDKLAIIAFRPNDTNQHTAVEFIIARGHSYALKAGEKINESLSEVAFRTEPVEQAATYQRLNVTSTYEATATVYLLPEEATSKFVRVKVDTVPLPAATE